MTARLKYTEPSPAQRENAQLIGGQADKRTGDRAMQKVHPTRSIGHSEPS